MSDIKILVTGVSSQVGSALCARALSAGVSVVWFDDSILNSLQLESIKAAIVSFNPSYVVNTASYSVVDLAEDNAQESYVFNHNVAIVLAQSCHELALPLLHLSTDYVFDGQQKVPYKEDSFAAPVNRFGTVERIARVTGEALTCVACIRVRVSHAVLHRRIVHRDVWDWLDRLVNCHSFAC